MCIHIEYCPKCNNEIDRTLRCAENDDPHEEWEAPIDNNGDCTCPEEFKFQIDNPLECENCCEIKVIP